MSKFHRGDRVVLRFHRHPRRKGKPLSPEHRAKLSAAKSGGNLHFSGKPLTPGHRAKISAANKGKQHSPEARAKISAKAKERESRKRLLLSAPAPAPEPAIQSVFR